MTDKLKIMTALCCILAVLLVAAVGVLINNRVEYESLKYQLEEINRG